MGLARITITKQRILIFVRIAHKHNNRTIHFLEANIQHASYNTRHHENVRNQTASPGDIRLPCELIGLIVFNLSLL
jgi:hypothetical protein